MSCKYCTFFFNSPKRIFLDEQDKIKSRLCTKKNKFVKSSGTCDDFKFSTFIWCVRWEYWMSVVSCGYKRMSQNEDCKGCRQGKEISELRKGLSFKKRTVEKSSEEKPKLVIRRK